MSTFSSKTFLFATAFTTASVLTQAASASATDNQSGQSTDIETLKYETVVVTATRTAQTANDTISSVKVITREDIIKSQASSVPDLLRGMAGIHFTQNGGRGTNSSLFMRGTNSDHTIVLIDGVKVGSATSGTAAFQNLPMEQIERIEVVRGPRSSLYGSEALGGVVQIFTKRGDGKPTFNTHATLGSKDTVELSAGIHGSEGGLFYNLSVERSETHGINSCKPEAATMFGGCFANEPDSDGYENLAGSFRLGFRFDKGTEMSLFTLQSKSESEFDGNFQNNADSREGVIGANLKFVIDDNIDINAQFAQTEDNSDNFKDGIYSSTFDTTRDAGSIQANLVILDRDMLTFGTDYQKDKITSNTAYDDRRRENYGVFSQYLMSLDNHDFELSTRYDYNDGFKDKLTGSLGYGYKLNSNLRFIMSYGTAYKAPSFNELYYPFFGVPTLKPEESETFEFGLKGASELNSWSLVYFTSKIDELIGYDSSWNQLNIDRATIRGIEAELVQQLDEHWVFKADFTAIAPINRSAGANEGNLLARRPERSGRINLDYQEQDWSAGVSINHAGTHFDDVANTKKLKAYRTVDLTSQVKMTESLLLQARVENIFDTSYETAQFYNQPGRGFFVTLRSEF